MITEVELNHVMPPARLLLRFPFALSDKTCLTVPKFKLLKTRIAYY
jgi:hypothetical protein